MPRITKAQAAANMQAAQVLEAAGVVPAAPVANAPISPNIANSTIVIPPPPPGMDKAVWEAYFMANLASKPATTRAPRGTASGITELTPETAQKMHDAGNIAAWVRAGKLGTVEILPTDGTEGCYSLALIQNGKVTQVEPAHVDRVKSPRHLPRALRLAGTWIGEHSDSGFQNGPTGKAATKTVEGVTLTPEQVLQVAATGSKAMTEEQVTAMAAQNVATPRAHVPTAEEVASALIAKAEGIGGNHVGAGRASKKVTKKVASKSTKAAKKTTRR